MKRVLAYLVFGLLAYVAALVVTVPAEQVLGYLLPQLKERGIVVAVAGVDGSAWVGGAQNVTVNGIPLGAVHWRVKPLSVLNGYLAAQWQVQQNDGYVGGELRMALDGSASLHGVDGLFPATVLSRYSKALPVALGGRFALSLEQVLWSDGHPAELSGTVVWNQALVEGDPPMPLGDLKLTLASDKDGGIAGKLSDGGGPLAAEGEVNVGLDRRYKIDALLSTRASATPELSDMVRVLGRRDRSGKVRVTFSGRL